MDIENQWKSPIYELSQVLVFKMMIFHIHDYQRVTECMIWYFLLAPKGSKGSNFKDQATEDQLVKTGTSS